MKNTVLFITIFAASAAVADEFDVTPAKPLFDSSCITCHDASTDTPLNLKSLSNDLSDAETFRTWEKIHDRVARGEMPPASELQPNDAHKQAALSQLKQELTKANLRSRRAGCRVPSRRLTRQEYEHTLHDLLGIGGDLAKQLPPENKSGAFDVVAAKQDISSVQVQALLKAASLALDETIRVGPRPNMKPRPIDYFNSKYIQMWVDRPLRRGGGTVFKTGKDVVTFRGANYVLRSDQNGVRFPIAGRYRITVKAAAYQPTSSITVSLKRQNDTQGESELFAAWDLVGNDYREVTATKYLRTDDYIYVSADELDPAPDGKVIYNIQPASEYKGEGVSIRRVIVEGPLETTWPPQRTRNLFPGIEWKPTGQTFQPVFNKSPIEHIHDAVASLAPRAFRRPVSNAEVDQLVELAKPNLKAKRSFIECAKIPLRAILVSPELMFLRNETADAIVKRGADSRGGFPNRLNDHALASRLSYFLWRSLPDDELTGLASDGRLTDPKVLTAQVERMLDHPRSDRFVHEFLDQWLELERIDATTPDAYLYPEYDDVLRQAMLAETRDFFRHLIDKDLSVRNLIDSDFTFLNRKLADHYGIDGVEGEAMRKVKLKPQSFRGGVLTHASIAKITANGTVTTPVKRGNFVLTNLLGLPPNPPPPGVGAIEPDTRGATTIRETLEKHKSVEACAVCHRRIDPPGFALECFDPVGTFRFRYRNSKGVKRTASVGLRFKHKDYNLGRAVDTSGVTADGDKFAGISQYKKQLLKYQKQVARQVLSQLITFATGGEIEFADRDEVERILHATEAGGYPLRSLIHHVVASPLFRNR
ncbi:DUF1592 domain-containing protein [bacterium]|nr:DUF1592 domain-containing protein [bacterium]